MYNIVAQVTHNLLWCRESTWTPPADHKRCTGCGVQRLSAWYNKKPVPTQLNSRCMPCESLYNRQRLRRCRQALDSKDPITAKMCKGCKLTLPADSFTADVTSKDGYFPKCRDCRQVQYAARGKERLKRSRNQTLVLAKGTERICTHCHVVKPWAEFSKNVNTTTGIESTCKQCVNTRQYLKRSILRKLQARSDR